jgi:ABC-type Fe3+-siderophore transport system permease subunit
LLRSARCSRNVTPGPVVGSTHVSISGAFDRTIPFPDNLDAQIFFIARLPRVVAAALVGGSLAAAGVVFQALLRNPLASPDTLGVSSGAALGAMIAITFHLDVPLLGLPAVRCPASSVRCVRSASSTRSPRRAGGDCRPPCCCWLASR